MKIVRNTGCGFAISIEAAKFMANLGSERAIEELKEYEENNKNDWFGFGYVSNTEGGYDRTDPLLIMSVETLGAKANHEGSYLEIIEIPDDVKWYIYESDSGYETICEHHRVW